MTAATWTDHPAMEQVPEPLRAALIEAVGSSRWPDGIAQEFGLPLAVVETLRAAKKREGLIARRKIETIRRRELRRAAGMKERAPKGPSTKPCACGRPGCIAERREGESASNWWGRKYATIACSRSAAARANAARHAKEAPPAPVAQEVAPEEPIDLLDALLDAHGERWPWDDDVGEHVLGVPYRFGGVWREGV